MADGCNACSVSEAGGPSEKLDNLATVEAALKRKAAALRALMQRLDSRGSRSIPTEEASRLAILQREVASLERSRDTELLNLASPQGRKGRLRTSTPPAEPPPPLPPVDSLPTPLTIAATPPRVSTNGERPGTVADSVGADRGGGGVNSAWHAYRHAQAARVAELRGSMRESWRARNGEIATIKQRVSPRIDSRMSPRAAAALKSAADDRTARRAASAGLVEERRQQLQVLVKMAPSATASMARNQPDVEGRRCDQKELSAEMRAQRQREWARQSANLRRIRQEGSARVQTTHTAEVLYQMAAKPLHMLSLASSPSAPPSCFGSARRHSSASGAEVALSSSPPHPDGYLHYPGDYSARSRYSSRSTLQPQRSMGASSFASSSYAGGSPAPSLASGRQKPWY